MVGMVRIMILQQRFLFKSLIYPLIQKLYTFVCSAEDSSKMLKARAHKIIQI